MTFLNQNFRNSPFFVAEPDNWHLLKGAPLEVVKEFNDFMELYAKKEKARINGN